MSSEVEIRAPAEQTEGTRSQILRWLKSVGDSVAENEPLIELETDKVTVEVASPGSGTLREILKQEQEEIGPGELLGWIDDAAGAALPAGETLGALAGAESGDDGRGDVDARLAPNGAHERDDGRAATGLSGATVSAELTRTAGGGSATEPENSNVERPSSAASPGPGSHAAGPASQNLSPAVRRVLAERGLDSSEVRGTGQGGRVTVTDVLAHGTGQLSPRARPGVLSGTVADGVGKATAAGGHASSSSSAAGDLMPAMARDQGAGRTDATNGASRAPNLEAGGPSHRVPHTATRKRIAEHMVQSLLHTAPHVTTVFEADFTAVLEHRQRNKEDFARRGAALTLTAYFLQATVAAIRAVPEANSRWTESALEIFDAIHIGVATALETGLVVPVLRDVQSRDMFETAKGLDDLVSRARDGRLTPADVRGGTFTISNHGVSGSLVATPIIINQPQSAILGIGKLEKRPVVVASEDGGEDRIVIRPRCYVTLTIDHRVMDGHQANRFLQTFIERLEKPLAG